MARLVRLLALGRDQVVVYGQGIGTPHGAGKAVANFRAALDEGAQLSLVPLAPPPAWAGPFTLATQALGWGLAANVRQLYVALSALQEPADDVLLFGFSRGAFAVRALAGLVWRYGLPAARDEMTARRRFAAAWPRFRAEFPDPSGGKARAAGEFRADGRECGFAFLGLWDTVKSYGGLNPIILPHLRHNPAVRAVRHALALDERRAWYEPTTWGRLDLDRGTGLDSRTDYPMARIAAADRIRIEAQDIREVWFAGSHSDVGGGGPARDTAAIALRWMLAEAVSIVPSLQLNEDGERLLRAAPVSAAPVTTDSYSAWWRFADRIPRRTIVNEGTWPRLVRAKPGAAPREPWKSARDGRVYLHDSVACVPSFPLSVNLEIVRVSTGSALPRSGDCGEVPFPAVPVHQAAEQ